jgi:hypothetical protein
MISDMMVDYYAMLSLLKARQEFEYKHYLIIRDAQAKLRHLTSLNELGLKND